MTGVTVSLTLFAATLTMAVTVERQHIQMRTGSYRNGHCHLKGKYAQDFDSFNSLDTERTHRLGSKWEERCRNCSCDSVGALCSGPSCPEVYDFTQETWCLQWSEDSCCCERLGCTVDGEQYNIGEEYPFGEDNPCLMCTCQIGASREFCLRQKCGTYYIMCEEGNVTYDDNCCPHFTCPVGVTCDHIPDPFPNTPRDELKDWFGNHLEPIPIGTTQYFHLDSFNTYVCRCPRGGTAVCKMETFARH